MWCTPVSRFSCGSSYLSLLLNSGSPDSIATLSLLSLYGMSAPHAICVTHELHIMDISACYKWNKNMITRLLGATRTSPSTPQAYDPTRKTTKSLVLSMIMAHNSLAVDLWSCSTMLKGSLASRSYKRVSTARSMTDQMAWECFCCTEISCHLFGSTEPPKLVLRSDILFATKRHLKSRVGSPLYKGNIDRTNLEEEITSEFLGQFST